MEKDIPSKIKNPQSLRVLIVEDSEDNALLVLRALKKGGYDPLSERVETAAAMKKALKEKHWDIILCDYKMPKFSGKQAIGLLKETNIDIPLIIVSGTVGEETAIECMRSGAHDYIMKNSLSRLCPAIARELEEAEVRNKQRQAENTLRESETKLQAIFDKVGTGIFIIDADTQIITEANQAAIEMTGLSKERIIGQICNSLVCPALAGKCPVKDLGQSIHQSERKLLHADGHQIDILKTVYPIKMNGRNCYLESFIDISDRLQAEGALQESEKYFKEITENSSDIIIITDKNGNIKYCSRSIERFTGYKPAELIGRVALTLIHPDDKKRAVSDYGKAILAKDSAIPNAFRIVHKDGSERYFEGLGKSLLDNPAVVGFIMNVRDVTERKQAEEALRESERKYKSLIDNFQDIILSINLEGKITFASQNIKEKLGYESAETINMSILDFVPEEDHQRVLESLQKGMKGEKIKGFQTQVITKSGERLFFEGSFSRVYKDGAVVGAQAIIKDITESKKMEETLRQSEQRYRTILDEMADAYFEVDIAGNYTFVNDSVCHHLKYTREELIGTSFRDQIVKEELAKVYKAFGKVYITGMPERNILYELFRKDGTTGFGEMTAFPLKNKLGEVIGFRGVGRDVSERKKMEEDLRQSEERYRSILDEMADAYFEVDIAGNYTFLNDACCRHLGYAREELIGTTFRGQMAKEDIGMVYDTCAKIFQTGKPEQISSYKILRKDKTIGFTKMIVFPLKNQQGEIIGLRGVGQDVTESKRAEEERKQSFDRLRKALGATVQSISTIVEMKDPYTAGHQQRVSDLARSIATEMGLSADQRDFIRTASAIHDIGKISIPAEILSKPTKLTDLEFNLIKTHSQSGHDILKDIEFPWPVADVVLQHHERMDGSGYPQGLKGNDILLEARIMAVADVVEAIASHRPYRPSRGIDFALDEISRNKGILYDADVVDACLKLFREKGYTLVFKKS